jgi:hypothetical protein
MNTTNGRSLTYKEELLFAEAMVAPFAVHKIVGLLGDYAPW